MGRNRGLAVALSYAAFVLTGASFGAGGVLLPPQMRDYGVGRATIGITFFTGSAGWVLAGLGTGVLIHRFGIRLVLAGAGGMFVLSGLYLATRPPFAAFVLVRLITGLAAGLLESVLNVYVAALPDATAVLNRLHAFFGVGALIGPVLAAWILAGASWPVVWLVLGIACVPVTAGFLAVFPRPQPADPAGPAEPAERGIGLLNAALRDRGVLLGAVLLAVYVGVEAGVGNWGFSYLVQARSLPGQLAGYSISGYWLGLTLGRLLISPAAARIGASTVGVMYACMAGVIAATAAAWVSPAAVLASVALVLLGFFLGPIFPTMMAITPRLTPARLVPSAIGVLNAAAVGGGSALPWLAGAIAQDSGIWIILPFTLSLALLQLAIWRPISVRVSLSCSGSPAATCATAD
ncbi:MAG TPA: MFS transporter [Streptosporangiaceae bacterium]|nr:MFS transporter [Streptosporangiaceae bacterium]